MPLPATTATTRLLATVRTALLADAAIKRVDLEWRHYRRVDPVEFPWLGLEIADDSDLEIHPAKREVEDLPFDLWGYIRTAESGLGRQVERERLLTLANSIMLGDTLRTSLVTEFSANGGNGCDGYIRRDGGAARDKGHLGPYGVFRQPYIARLQVARGS